VGECRNRRQIAVGKGGGGFEWVVGGVDQGEFSQLAHTKQSKTERSGAEEHRGRAHAN